MPEDDGNPFNDVLVSSSTCMVELVGKLFAHTAEKSNNSAGREGRGKMFGKGTGK